MQTDDLTPEQARELAKTKLWTVQALLDKLPRVYPWWIRDALPYFGGDRAELEARIIGRMEEQPQERPRVYLGLVLFFLGHPLGKAAFFQGLASLYPSVRALVLDQLRIFRVGDLDIGDRPGQLPISRAEVCAALCPFLSDPSGSEGRIALEFLLQGGNLGLVIPNLKPLFTHPDPAVRSHVLLAFLRQGFDEGALDKLAGKLLESSAASGNERKLLNDAGRALHECLKANSDEALRQRIGALVMGIFQQTLAAPDAAVRIETLGDGAEWLDVLTLAKPEGVETILDRLIETTAAPLSLRANAALRYKYLTGRNAESSQALIQALIQEPADYAQTQCFAQFIQHGLVGMELLTQAAAYPGWCYEATKAIKEWPRGADDALAVSGLIAALRTRVERSYDERYLVETLYGLPRTEADNLAIIAALRQALANARQDKSRPWIVKQPLHQLLMFGDLSAADEDGIDPWDATWAHWLKNGWAMQDIARLLHAAGLMEPLEDASAAQPISQWHDPQSQLLGLLWKDQDDQRIVYQSIRDNGFEPEHDKLFGQLAASVRPRLELEALSQTWDHHWMELDVPLQSLTRGETDQTTALNIPVYSTEGTCALVRFVYQGRVYRFQVTPNSTWMDVWGVLDAFNRFMETQGRPERAYWLASPWDESGEWGMFICPHAERFAKINTLLKLPLRVRES